MRQRYIVYYNGRAIGWVHAANPVEAIRRVAAVTGKPVDECAARMFEVKAYSFGVQRLIAAFRPPWYAAAMAFSHEHVESIKRQVEKTLGALKLTPEEDEFARELASDLFDRATQAFVNIEGE